ncbi:MAG: sigma-54-dependent transcriptional regulator [Nannocystaceae bacterium]
MTHLQHDEASTLADGSEAAGAQEAPGAKRSLCSLVLVWSRDEPSRVGEVVIVPRHARSVSFSIGRARSAGQDGSIPLAFSRLRPFEVEARGPLQAARVSRRHLRLKFVEGALEVEHPGRGQLAINGSHVASAKVKEGDIIESVGRFMLLVSRRPASWRTQPATDAAKHFGEKDPSGIVGESEAAWVLRRQLKFAARHSAPVLVHGASGSGKELVVQAIHKASPFATRPLVARNAATLPEALIDAELFGNLKNYPNPGMPERPGLLGEADGSSLFLDEIGELPQAMQAHLLRVMDSGEYQRLGEARPRVTRARLIGATNRELGELKHDLLARFTLRVYVQGLPERRGDIMLIARHLVRSFADEDPELRDTFFTDGEPRFDPKLVHSLVRASYTTHVRQLTEILWRSIAASTGSTLQLPPGDCLPEEPETSDDPPKTVDVKHVTREQVIAALERCDGVRERTWRALGLRSRHQLKRLLKRHDIH